MRVSLIGSLLFLLPVASGQCDATLQVSTLKGHSQCSPDGMKQIQDDKARAVSECFFECASGYTIQAANDKGANMATATSKQSVCRREELDFQVLCSPVALECAKSFTEFPNACTGTIRLAGTVIYVAFYSSCQQTPKGFSTSLEMQSYFGKGICTGTYTFDTQKGTCMGLQPTCEKVALPPRPPNIAGLSMSVFPPLGASGCEGSLIAPLSHLSEPQGCTAESVKDYIAGDNAKHERDVLECFLECTASLSLTWDRGQSWNKVIAKPHLDKCSNVQEDCRPVSLTCSKSFGDFPNACAGKVEYKRSVPGTFWKITKPFWVAIYSYRTAVDGIATNVLDMRLQHGNADQKIVSCGGRYLRNTGQCLGLPNARGLVVGPPEPPQVDPPQSWSMPKVQQPDPSKTTEPPTEPPTEKPTQETTEKPTKPEEKPEEPSKQPEEKPSNNTFQWIFIAVLTLALGVFLFFYYRRNQMISEDQRRLQMQEVAIHNMGPDVTIYT